MKRTGYWYGIRYPRPLWFVVLWRSCTTVVFIAASIPMFLWFISYPGWNAFIWTNYDTLLGAALPTAFQMFSVYIIVFALNIPLHLFRTGVYWLVYRPKLSNSKLQHQISEFREAHPEIQYYNFRAPWEPSREVWGVFENRKMIRLPLKHNVDEYLVEKEYQRERVRCFEHYAARYAMATGRSNRLSGPHDNSSGNPVV